MGAPTRGPWEVRHDFNVFGADVQHGGSRLVASAGGHSNNVTPLEADAENRANALLIAAAPELLEALRGIIEIGKRNMENPKYDGYFEYAVAAIAKAEGK